jgi:serine phosphatase RsbU (regulator of sigma subunit)
MLPDMEYGQLSDALAPGETLVLFTDGIIESRNASEEEYGCDRLVEICRKSTGADANETMAAVFRDLEAFTSKAPAADDRTLVVVKREA